MDLRDNDSPERDSPENGSAEAEKWIDRLVDGELNDEQRREVLIKLDGQSDGWRRCALAFLEAQAWGREFRALTTAPARDVAVQPARTQATWRATYAMPMLAMAASFLVAFGLGLAWRGNTPFDAVPTQVAQQQPASETAPAAEPNGAPSVTPTDRPHWDTVTVSLDENQDGVAEAVDVPFAAGEGIDEQWLRSQPSPLPPQVLRALRHMGHEVQRQRAYLPIELNDGRRVVVPVDQFDVHFVGQRVYQ
jgi:hypothetical protein